jgi:hypothetical protein
MIEDSLELADPLDPFDVAAAHSVAQTDHETAIATQQAALRARQGAYIRLFSDRPIAGDAAFVLADLRRFCRGGQTPWADDARLHALLTGRNEVYTRVTQHVSMQFDDLWELLSEGKT